MTCRFTEDEVGALREHFVHNNTTDNFGLTKISGRPLDVLEPLLRRNKQLFYDENVSNSFIVSTLNDQLDQKEAQGQWIMPPPIEPPVNPNIDQAILSANAIAIPPKFRGKPMAKTPTVSAQSTTSFSVPSSNPGPFSSDSQLLSIPILPRYVSSHPAVGRHGKDLVSPGVGSLAAILYPALGPAHVCRVLGKCVQNEHECCLVTFFQTERSPCYVPSEYLFELQSHIVFPLGDEEKFKEYMLNEDVCVDWLLERIFSAAQNIGAIYHAEVLFPFDPAKEATFRPTPQQVQQLMFQCVSLAALLIVCYVAGKWTIPEGKLGLILSTILRTSAPKYTSTQNIMSKVEDLLAQLLSIRKE